MEGAEPRSATVVARLRGAVASTPASRACGPRPSSPYSLGSFRRRSSSASVGSWNANDPALDLARALVRRDDHSRRRRGALDQLGRDTEGS